MSSRPVFYSVWIHPDEEHLLAIADLEPEFGTPYADDPAAFFVELWFPWEPQGEGKMRCRLRARVKYGEEGGYDEKTQRLEPGVDRTLVHLDTFYLDRGVIEGAGGVLSAEPILHPAVPSSGNQARRFDAGIPL